MYSLPVLVINSLNEVKIKMSSGLCSAGGFIRESFLASSASGGCRCFLAVTANPTSASVFTWMFTLVSFLRTLVSASWNLIRQTDPVLWSNTHDAVWHVLKRGICKDHEMCSVDMKEGRAGRLDSHLFSRYLRTSETEWSKIPQLRHDGNNSWTQSFWQLLRGYMLSGSWKQRGCPLSR